MRRAIPIVFMAGALCAGCGGAGAGQVPAGQLPSARAAAAQITGGRCPKQEPPYVASTGKGLGGALVPGSPRTMVVCRYAGLNDAPPLGLEGEGTVTDEASVRAWRQRFDALPTPRGRFNCPNDDGSALLAGFAGGRGAAVVVKVELRGCQFASNGATSRSAAGSFLDDLSRLAG